MPLCTACNTDNLDTALICGKCNAPLNTNVPSKKRKDDQLDTQVLKREKSDVIVITPVKKSVSWSNGDWWAAKQSTDIVFLGCETAKGYPTVVRPLVALAKIIPRKVGSRGGVPSPLAFLTESERSELEGYKATSPTGRFAILSTPFNGYAEEKIHLWSDDLYASSTEAPTVEELEAEAQAEQDQLNLLEGEDDDADKKEEQVEQEKEEEAEKEKPKTEIVVSQPTFDLGSVDSSTLVASFTPLPPSKKESDLDRLTTMFDKGHLFALAIGGIDHCGQIAPQVRTCNRGTWLRMETRIASRDWKSVKERCWLKIQEKRKETALKASSEGNLETVNSIGESADIIGKIFIFYPTPDSRAFDWDKLVRIPLWFYFQIFFVTDKSETIGVAHYSIGNGQSLAALCPSKEEITAFLRAHKALGYLDPSTEETQTKIAKGLWYPDPPYAALQWLSDEADPVIKFRNFSTAGFASAAIDIIRKYNLWLNGGALGCEKGTLRSDHRPDVRTYRIALAKFDGTLMTKVKGGEKLGDQEIARLKDLIAEQQRQLNAIKKLDAPVPTALYKFPNESALRAFTQTEWDGVGILQRLQQDIEIAKQDISLRKKEIAQYQECWAAMKLRIVYLKEKLEPERQLRLFEDLVKNGSKASMEALRFAQDLIDQCGEILKDLELEQPDLYEILDITGGRGYPEVDHIVPKNRNGKNTYSNARLVSFAQNHIYRDKVYLNMKKTEKERGAAKKRCDENYSKEKLRTDAKIDVLRHHQQLVEEFRQKPDERLIPLILDFIEQYKVKLDDRSERPEEKMEMTL